MLEKTLESPLYSHEIKPVHPKGDQSWVFTERTDDEAETPILWPPHVKSWLIWKTLIWERLRAGGEGDDRRWDGWMASPTRWTWIWVNSGRWWWTGRPGVLHFMGLQRVGHDWATELNWTELVNNNRRRFSIILGTFTIRDHILDHKTNLNHLKQLKMIQNMLSDRNETN